MTETIAAIAPTHTMNERGMYYVSGEGWRISPSATEKQKKDYADYSLRVEQANTRKASVRGIAATNYLFQ